MNAVNHVRAASEFRLRNIQRNSAPCHVFPPLLERTYITPTTSETTKRSTLVPHRYFIYVWWFGKTGLIGHYSISPVSWIFTIPARARQSSQNPETDHNRVERRREENDFWEQRQVSARSVIGWG
jgi:hypothetical protein